MSFVKTPELALINGAGLQRLVDFRQVRSVPVEGRAGIFQLCLSIPLECARCTSLFSSLSITFSMERVMLIPYIGCNL